MQFRSLIPILFIALIWLPLPVLATEPSQPSVLEVAFESRLPSFEQTDSSNLISHELQAGIGLAWIPNTWVAIHGRISTGWMAIFEDSLHYRYHNTKKSTSHLGNLELAAFIDVHPYIQVLTIRAEISARSYFVSGRAGIWLIEAGIGIGAQPFDNLSATLRNTYLGFICRFPLYDEFETIFSVKRKMPELGIQFFIGF